MGRYKVITTQKSQQDEAPRPTYFQGGSMSPAEINAEIELVLGEVALKAYEKDRHILLDDGVNEPAEADDLTPTGLIELLYDWAVFAGYTTETFEDFLEAIE